MYTNAIIVIDVFRAFTTACYILERSPASYILTTHSKTVSELVTKKSNCILVGKPEKNINLIYHIPNSPTRTKELDVQNKNILHRTEAGAKGILIALKENPSIVLASSFVNADATARFIKANNIQRVTLMPMGHEGVTPTLEDTICAEYIDALIKNQKITIEKFIPLIKQESGKYFFQEDQWQYPKTDFDYCLERKKFNFIIKATSCYDHALLTRHDIHDVTI